MVVDSFQLITTHKLKRSVKLNILQLSILWLYIWLVTVAAP